VGDADERDDGHTPGERRRIGNDRLAEQAVGLRFQVDVRVPFWCECDDQDCGVVVPLTLPDYRDLCATGDALLAPDHLRARADGARQTARSLRESARALRNEAAQARRASRRRRNVGG